MARFKRLHRVLHLRVIADVDLAGDRPALAFRTLRDRRRGASFVEIEDADDGALRDQPYRCRAADAKRSTREEFRGTTVIPGTVRPDVVS